MRVNSEGAPATASASAVTFDLPDQSSGDDEAVAKGNLKDPMKAMARHHLLSRLVSQDELGANKEASSSCRDPKIETCSPCLASESSSLESTQDLPMETDDALPQAPSPSTQVPPLPNPLDDPSILKYHVSALRIEADLFPLRLILSRLMAHPTHNKKGIFNQPVDAEALGLKDYYEIVKHPMDLGTIKRRLYAVAYQSKTEATKDIRLVFSNAMQYNPPSNLVHISAKHLLSYFDSFCEGLGMTVACGNGNETASDLALHPKAEPMNSPSLSPIETPSAVTAPATASSSPTTEPCPEAAAAIDSAGSKESSEQRAPPPPASVTPHCKVDSAVSTRTKRGPISQCESSKVETPVQRPRLRIAKRRASFAGQLTTHACEQCKGRTCAVCLQGCLQHEPALLVCCGVQCHGSRIRKDAVYYITMDGSHQFCDRCYAALPSALGPSIRSDTCRYKQELLKRRYDEEIAEEWITCSECSAGVHVVCAMHNGYIHDESTYRCPTCLESLNEGQTATFEAEPASKTSAEDQVYTFVTGAEEPVPICTLMNSGTKVLDSDSLMECPVSSFIQEKVHKAMQSSLNASKTTTVRVISDCDRKFSVPKSVRRYFRAENVSSSGSMPPESVPYRQKAIVMFQKIDGMDVCVFCMYVQEYDGEGEDPDSKRVYVAYIDSVEHFRPRELRTNVFHEILIAYLATARERGFHKAHIWACPPSRGNCFVFWNHPVSQRTPTSERLLAWYHGALSLAIESGVVADVKSLYESDFEQQLARLSNDNDESKVFCPPLIDGDFWVDEAVRVHQTAIERNLLARSPTEVCVWNVGSSPVCRSRCPALQVGSLLKDRIMTHPSAVPFRRPVNAAAMKLKQYHTVIRKPIDLGTIYARCILGEYYRLQDVTDDVCLMVENAQKFNPPGHAVNSMAAEVLDLFHSMLGALTESWSGHNKDENGWRSHSEVSMSLDMTIEMEVPAASPEQILPDPAIVVIEDDRSSDGSTSIAPSVASVVSQAGAGPMDVSEDGTDLEVQPSAKNPKVKARGRPKSSKPFKVLDIYTDGPEAVMQRMAGDDKWMLNRKRDSEALKSLHSSGKKRRRSSCGGTPDVRDEEPRKRRQSWVCEEVGRSIRKMRLSFFVCSLSPSKRNEEYKEYVSSFQFQMKTQEASKSSLADTRSAVLELSQFRNFEFDTLRRAKYSTNMLLYYLHHPNGPGAVPSCHGCGTDIEHVRWHKTRKIRELNKPKKAPLRRNVAPPIRKVEEISQEPGPFREDLCTVCYESNRPNDEGYMPIPVSSKPRVP
ncbi:MAG: hypothetical protein SGILL_000257 [Bacillariaceae sp.]